MGFGKQAAETATPPIIRRMQNIPGYHANICLQMTLVKVVIYAIDVKTNTVIKNVRCNLVIVIGGYRQDFCFQICDESNVCPESNTNIWSFMTMALVNL